MATEHYIPRPGDSNPTLTDEEVAYIIGLAADNLQAAQEELDRIRTVAVSGNDKTHAAVANSHAAQAQSLMIYLAVVAGMD